MLTKSQIAMNKFILIIAIIFKGSFFAFCQLPKDSLLKVDNRQVLYVFLDEKANPVYNIKDSSVIQFRPKFDMEGYKVSLVFSGKLIDDNSKVSLHKKASNFQEIALSDKSIRNGITISSNQRLTKFQEIWTLLKLNDHSFKTKYRIIAFFYSEKRQQMLIQELIVHCPFCKED